MREKTKRLWILVLLVGIIWLGMLPGVSLAGEPLTIQELYLSVWPEYYTPDVVVSQACLLVNSSEEPVDGEIWFQLPMNVEPRSLVEVKEGIVPLYFEVVDKGDHQLVRYQLTEALQPGEQLSLMLEYGYPRFQEAGQRQIPVEFVSKYPVEQLEVEILQPLRSTDFVLTPAAESQSMDSEGFDVFRYTFTNLPPEQPLEFEISYNKEDNRPSLEPEPVTEQADEPKQGSLNNSTVALLLIIFLAALGIVLFLALKNNQPVRTGGKSKKAGANKTAGKTKSPKSINSKEKEGGGPVDRRKKLRKMLLEGKINEKNYEKLLEELDKEKQ